MNSKCTMRSQLPLNICKLLKDHLQSIGIDVSFICAGRFFIMTAKQELNTYLN